MIDQSEAEIRRAEHAERLLRDETLLEALTAIEQEYTDRWKTSPARDEEGREKLWLMVKTVDRLRTELESFVMTGKVAKDTLARRIGNRLNEYL